MFKPILAAGSIALALAASPALAQQSPAPDQSTNDKQSPSPDQSANQKADPSMVGLSVYSSDGQKLGKVSEVGTAGGQAAVRADMGEFLGINPGSVIIGGDAFSRKSDRVEIAMTAQQVKDAVSKQREQQQRKQP